MDHQLLKQLLHEAEGPNLDFKRDQYLFQKATNETKGELLKDILAFANAWRRTTAYILIGVEERQERRSRIVGVASHLEDASLQQFVNSKTQRPIEFSYQRFVADSRNIGIIDIPVQERPFWITKTFGKVKADTVYLRRGSSTDVATLAEIVSMSRPSERRPPRLMLQWGHIEKRTLLGDIVTAATTTLDPMLVVEAPTDDRKSVVGTIYADRNDDYPQQAVEYAFTKAFFSPVGLTLRNESEVVAKRVLFVGKVSKDSGVVMRSGDSMPDRPHLSRMQSLMSGIKPIHKSQVIAADPHVRELADRWEITLDFGSIRPRDEVWAAKPLFVGSRESARIDLVGELRADNLPEPLECVLSISIDNTVRAMTVDDVRIALGAA